MFKPDVEEAVPVLQIMLSALLGVVPQSGNDAAQCRMACGRLSANAGLWLRNDIAGVPFAQCFDLARRAGTTVYGLRAARDEFKERTTTLKTVGATLVRNTALRLSLATEGRIIADMTFVSMEDVDRVKSTLQAEFGEAQDIAADAMDAMTYRALIKLHAAIVAFLVQTARPLPRMLRYRFATVMPSLITAQRLYYDASRADELREENKVVHPAFMPITGRALSA
jgi:hypothetical protein